MVASRRSSTRISLQSAQPSSTKNSQFKPSKLASKRISQVSVATGADSDVSPQINKRRRTTRNGTSTATSEVTSPKSVTFSNTGTTDTPATAVSDDDLDTIDDKIYCMPDPKNPSSRVLIPPSDGESDIDEISDISDEYQPDIKGKGKSNMVYSDSEDEDIIPAQSKIRKGKAGQKQNRTLIIPDQDEESEFKLSDEVAHQSSGLSEVDDNLADITNVLPSQPSPLQLTPPAPRTRPRTSHRHGMTRAQINREKLYLVHPELKTIWTELKDAPGIPVKEDPQPPGLSLDLLPFQKEGLHWLRLQENSKYKGGILADEMGMGKTIQTLSLIMSDPKAKPNLVVAPTVAIMQWKSEIEKYTGKALSIYVFHGSSRTTDEKELRKHSVILTSYNLLESVFRKQESGYKRKAGLYKEASALHKIKYHRVILDEAHNIKDRTCNTARAVFALKTKYKLCLSGTPLQNRIGELFSLLRFLELDPFAYYFCRKCPCKQLHWKFSNKKTCDHCGHTPMSHLCFFNYDLLKPIQEHGNEGAGSVAFSNIHALMRHIMLRRTKNEREEDLGLPPKITSIRRDMFSDEELDLYDSIYSDGKRKFDTYVAQGVVLNNYANIFTLITRMRQMADHPDLVLRKYATDGQNTLVCHICDDEAEEAIKSKCHHVFCRDCIQRYVSGFDGENNPECPKCHITLSIDINQPALEINGLSLKKNSIISRIDMSKWRSSTKIEALCEELYKLRSPHQTTKSIVFSQFTSMLQLIEWRLRRAGFKTVMLEGSMNPFQRDSTIKHFMTNVDVEVFLVSLKAGGVALNLIEASHVFLMEPWWNPSVEWQAADRIHRIGQNRVCRITRMVIQDSIESRIIELQEKKARMIEATVNADHKAMDRLTAADMQFLFQN